MTAQTDQNPPSADQTITIEIDAKAATARHIEHLQDVITTRNATIAQLENRLAAGEESPLIAQARKEGFELGWCASAQSLINATDQMKQVLQDSRRVAIKNMLPPQETQFVQAFPGDDE